MKSQIRRLHICELLFCCHWSPLFSKMSRYWMTSKFWVVVSVGVILSMINSTQSLKMIQQQHCRTPTLNYINTNPKLEVTHCFQQSILGSECYVWRIEWHHRYTLIIVILTELRGRECFREGASRLFILTQLRGSECFREGAVYDYSVGTKN